MTRNTESRARALCALDLEAAKPRPRDVSAAIERYWPVVAREIEAGIPDGDMVPVEDLERRADEYRELLRGAKGSAQR